VGPKEGLNILEKRKISCPWRDSRLGPFNPSPGRYTDCIIPGPNGTLKSKKRKLLLTNMEHNSCVTQTMLLVNSVMSLYGVSAFRWPAGNASFIKFVAGGDELSEWMVWDGRRRTAHSSSGSGGTRLSAKGTRRAVHRAIFRSVAITALLFVHKVSRISFHKWHFWITSTQQLVCCVRTIVTQPTRSVKQFVL
jgi:hypothetical protein